MPTAADHFCCFCDAARAQCGVCNEQFHNRTSTYDWRRHFGPLGLGDLCRQVVIDRALLDTVGELDDLRRVLLLRDRWGRVILLLLALFDVLLTVVLVMLRRR